MTVVFRTRPVKPYVRIPPIADVPELLHFAMMDFTLGATWDSAFKSSPYRLRFELGGEDFGCADAPVPRFVQALTRSRTIRDAVFADATQLWAVVGWQAPAPYDAQASVRDRSKAFSNIGFRAKAVAEWRARPDPNELEQRRDDVLWQAFDVTSDIASQDAMLWCSIAYEMPIEPKSSVDCYLVDVERGILLHVYDDRGMDVSALTASPLQPIRKTFDRWLLDYDRDRVEAAFAAT